MLHVRQEWPAMSEPNGGKNYMFVAFLPPFLQFLPPFEPARFWSEYVANCGVHKKKNLPGH